MPYDTDERLKSYLDTNQMHREQMMSMRFYTARTQGPARHVTSTHHSRNSTLSDDLDVIVKSLALNSCNEQLHSEPNVPFPLKTRRIVDSGAHVRRWARSCLP